ncbi:MAG TPA: thymidine phosphorylase [Thermoanaerobaculia bacterium]|jgi:pyrimidine-nucleoside phosphorylase|nr:thymidine phosphorylase [Thermoanaerobaculia bacterium]
MASPAAAALVPYRILERKRAGLALREEEIRAVVTGSLRNWSDGQIGAFLMAAAIRGLDAAETRVLTEAMAQSGELWDLGAVLPRAIDKHSTGGVGDKVSMLLAPVIAACGLPVAKLTARGLGHTGGTADKLESVPGLVLDMDRDRCLRLLEQTGIAIGVPSASIAPADRRLYGLRNLTATVDCLPLVASSVLAKKLALGARSLVFDVKTGDGAFFSRLEDSVALAELLVSTAEELGRRAVAVVSDMSQPLGQWAGHACEVREVVECLRAGTGDARLLEVTTTLATRVAALAGIELDAARALDVLRSGKAWESFHAWAAAQGADPAWLDRPRFEIAPVELVAEAPVSGRLAAVATRELGMLLLEAGGGRKTAGALIDPAISLSYRVRLGDQVEAGEELARLYVQEGSEGLRVAFARCFRVETEGASPPVVHRVIGSRRAG